jgi:biotin carboxyl carrier protein
MKYRVSVGGQRYEVEIKDLNVRPITVQVDGEAFEVMPENEAPSLGGPPPLSSGTGKKEPSSNQQGVTALSKPPAGENAGTLTAPLPGTVSEVFVRPGEVIERGHVVLVIEAMKMKNSIRAVRGGKVVEVLVSAGQAVSHKQVLVRFEGAESGQ